jgi:hypothetical protein
MIIKNLQLNRFLGKDPNQDDATKSAVFLGSNPVQKRGHTDARKLGRGDGNEEDNGAPNVLTGTVITSCFIQTSALPSRIELAGNDATFYDDTFTESGVVKGDTSRLVFTHDLDGTEGFIMEKRASINDTYDNVLSWYATPARTGKVNYLYIGRNGNSADPKRNVRYFEMVANGESTGPSSTASNGQIRMNMSVDGVEDPNAVIGLAYGRSIGAFTGIRANVAGTGDGSGTDTGGVQLSYYLNGVFTYGIVLDKDGIQMFGLPTSAVGLPSGAVYRIGSALNIVP